MGLHLWISKFIGTEEDEPFGEAPITYYNTKRQDWFDSVRHSGDKEFVLDNDFTYIDHAREVEERSLARPVDFNKSREWVKEHVYEGNQERLLNALDKMEKDKSLSFSWSW